MRKYSILWVDNDPAFVLPFALFINQQEFEVTIARTVGEAEVHLTTGTFDLIILDVMIPVTDAELLDGYDALATDESHKTGLVFYARHAHRLRELHTPVLVLTVRVDRAIMDEFGQAGLPREMFVTKMELREAPVFLARLREVVSKGR